MLKISIIGTGYVGLVSGTCFAELGHHVTCVDTDHSKIDLLKAGVSPIFEEHLEEMIKKNIANKRLSFTTDLNKVLNHSNIVIIAVGTPTLSGGSGEVDLHAINVCVKNIAKLLLKDMVVIIKSTVPVGTCDAAQKYFDEKAPHKVRVISNPEFLREGTAIHDFLNPDRIIIGGDKEVSDIVSVLYKPLTKKEIPLVHTTRTTAELIKYAANAFLAMKVGFINEIANISEKIDANIADIKLGLGLDARIGNKFLTPGPGFGGSCFPKDVLALINTSKGHGIDNAIISSIIESNHARAFNLSKKIERYLDAGEIVAVLGLTYKANTDDVRDSPALPILDNIKNRTIHVYDPEGLENFKQLNKNKSIKCFDNLYEAAKDASLLVVMTEWEKFKHLDMSKLSMAMKKKRVYDLRGIINKKLFVKYDFEINMVGYKNEF